MKISIGADHAGYELKEKLKQRLVQEGVQIDDEGTLSNESVDYPDFIRPAAIAVAEGECERGVVFGGSGNGEAIAANRVKRVRCILAWSEESARLGRAHNDANMLSIGQRLLSEDLVRSIVQIWMTTPFEGGRHIARLQKLDR